MYAVELRNVTKKFTSRTIFQDVCLTVGDGEFAAMIGPSGCGKSTILNMIGALEPCEEGEILIFGKKLPDVNSREATLLRRKSVNYLFQSFALISEMSVYQNLMLALHFANISQREKEVRIDRILEAVHLLTLKDAAVNTLSGGEQQRTALARTILKPGKLVLADEPTGALDARSAEEAFSLLQSLSRQYKKTVLMVTHSLELAGRTDRVIDLTAYGPRHF